MLVSCADSVEWDWLSSLPRGTPGAKEAFADILRRYGEPHRYYHNLSHVAQVVHTLGSVFGRHDPELRLAAMLHDVIYDPRAKDNEERSAEFARESLASLGVPRATREEVARLILLTKTHQTSAADPAGAMLLDADLAVLSADQGKYEAYAEAIRKEYAWVPETDYRPGRRRVLEQFLARPRLYHTPEFQPNEARARANLAREIASLS